MNSWRDNVRKVEPYTPGEQPKEEGVIKLNTNENPYPPSEKIKEAMSEIKNLRKYPDPVSYTHLRAHETDSYLVCRLLLEKKKMPASA